MDSTPTSEMILPIQGMNCSGCVANVERAIRKLAGVTRVNVDLRNNRAVIEYDPGQVGKPDFEAAVERAGYSVPADTPSTFNTARFKNFKKPTGTG
jgi:copper chaperone CopZ